MRSFLASLLLLAPLSASGQTPTDSTPPVLLDFTMAPVLIDTTDADVRINFCVFAADDFSGVASIQVRIFLFNGSSWSATAGVSNPQRASVCDFLTIRRLTAFDPMRVEVFLQDSFGNRRTYSAPDFGPRSGFEWADLCPIGPCVVVNEPLGGLVDSDGDGVLDHLDNCPTDSNANQADADLDLIGDVCDPFPNDRDNAQAQCEADVGACLAAGGPDADADGEADVTDRCPGTPGTDVDDSGCDLAQFCARVDATTRAGKRECRRSDFRGDEFAVFGRPKDCIVDRGARGPSDDLCVPGP